MIVLCSEYFLTDDAKRIWCFCIANNQSRFLPSAITGVSNTGNKLVAVLILSPQQLPTVSATSRSPVAAFDVLLFFPVHPEARR